MVSQWVVNAPLWTVNTATMMQLVNENTAFQQPFYWIPNLNGAIITQTLELGWLTDPSIDKAPYLVLPSIILLLQSVQTYVENYDQEEQCNSVFNLDYLIPLTFASISLSMPSLVSLSWASNSFANLVQFYGIRAKLKYFDNIDTAAIINKEHEIREKLSLLPVGLEDYMYQSQRAPVT